MTAAVVGLAALVVGVGLVAITYPRLPPLLAGLACSPTTNCVDEMNNRLRRRFPIGSSESFLLRELQAEDFTPIAKPDDLQRTFTHAVMGDFIHNICRRDGYVSWSADSAGRITDISGALRTLCP